MENPNSLIIWEAQFGDFANGAHAHVIFDNFLASGESKWLRQTGLVVLLPHGYDGQGPEHSSAELERFLQGIGSQEQYPMSGRSSQYCTDVAKALNAPIFHVNGDDVKAVVHACELAAEWRQTFHSYVVVDLVCYRRFGHNEIDEPSFTQPKMYKVIRGHPSTLEIYQKKLVESGELTQDDIDKIHTKVTSILTDEFQASKDYTPKRRDWLSAYWLGFKSPEQLSRVRNTGVKPEILKNVGKAITTILENFTPHKAVKRIYEQRAQMIETGEDIDWGFGEALAFATLLVEGNHVRLSGQDVERGTFSHRHSVVHDQITGEKYCPLDNVIMNQNEEMFTVSNSSLSEFAVLGFELGYSMENPNSLIIWEAQFGDFANRAHAHVIFDNFLASGESKWLRQTGLVVLLPHGYDGQGPEHSSAELERFLQGIGYQEHDKSSRRFSSLPQLTYPKDESQPPNSRSSSNLLVKWNSADNKNQLSEGLEQRIAIMETSLGTFAMIMDSVQSEIMQVKKGTKEIILEMECITQKLIAQDCFHPQGNMDWDVNPRNVMIDRKLVGGQRKSKGNGKFKRRRGQRRRRGFRIPVRVQHRRRQPHRRHQRHRRDFLPVPRVQRRGRAENVLPVPRVQRRGRAEIVLLVPRVIPETRKRALIVGIDYYGSWDKLHGCSLDARKVKDSLMAYMHFDSDEILLMLDATSNRRQPRYDSALVTENSIRVAILDLLRNATNGAHLMIYLSGHGGADEQGGIYYTRDGSITDTFIRESIAFMPHGCRLTVTADCCDAGSFDLGDQAVFIGSCSEGQYSSTYFNKKTNRSESAFTAAMLKVIKKRGGVVTNADLVAWTALILNDWGKDQVPLLKCRDVRREDQYIGWDD